MSRPHGIARYKEDGCRCYVCGFAHSEYSVRRRGLIKARQWRPWVAITPVRAHLLALLDAGYSYRILAEITGLSHTHIGNIRRGQLSRVRASTAAALMAIPIDQDQAPDGIRVDAAPTWALIEDLARRGWSKAGIAREAGLGRSIQLGRDTVTARNARRLEALHERATRIGGVSVADVELLIETETPQGMAKRLGYTVSSLCSRMRTEGRHDLARRIEAVAS